MNQGMRAGCYRAYKLEGMKQEPNPPKDFTSLVTSPSPTGFALILTWVQSIAMCHRDAQCSQKTGSMRDKGWHLSFCSFPVLPMCHWEGPHQPGCSRESMWHSSNCTETTPKQSPKGEPLNDPPLLTGRAFMGISPLKAGPKSPPKALILCRHKLCSPSLQLYLQRELKSCWENLPCALITACIASSKWLFINE